MRLTISFKASSGSLILPYNYNEMIQGFIYRSINDLQLSHFLHDQGFQKENRVFKMFTFSRLQGSFKNLSKEKRIAFTGETTLSISSALDNLIQDLYIRFLKASNLRINDQQIEILTVKVSKEVVQKREKYRIKMLSPITVYSTINNNQKQKSHTHYYSPFELLFPDMVEKNFVNKYDAFFREKPEKGLAIIPFKINRRNKIVTKYKNNYITSWNGVFNVYTSVENMNFLYNVGIGGKNAQGFGMFEILN